MPAPAAAIPAWAIWTMIGSSAAGGMLKGIGANKQADANLKQRNKELAASTLMQNKQLKQNADQFRQMQSLKEKESVESGPAKLMSTMNMIGNLGKSGSNTADSLKYLIS